MPEYATKPTVSELAALLRTRTVDEYGNELDAFTDATRPTSAQASTIIDSAYDLVNLRIGKIPDIEDLASQAKSVILLLAARLVETVYYPEQASSDQSAASLYGELYEDSIRDLTNSINQDRAGGSFMNSIPTYGMANVYGDGSDEEDLDDEDDLFIEVP